MRVTADNIKRLMMRNYRRFSRGQITESQAYKENAILSNILKAIEVSETEERLRILENTINLTRNFTDNDNENNNDEEDQ